MTKSLTGGACIGWTNASWPLATLTVDSGTLVVKVRLLGTYTFLPSQIVSIKPYGFIPVVGQGVLIVHTVPNYPQTIIFWYLGSSKTILDAVKTAGFIPSAPSTAVPVREGWVISWQTVIVLVGLWNLLFMLPTLPQWLGKAPLYSANSRFAVLPFVVVFVGCVLLLRLPALQRLVLKPGRQIGEIAGAIYLLLFISGLFLAVGLLGL